MNTQNNNAQGQRKFKPRPSFAATLAAHGSGRQSIGDLITATAGFAQLEAATTIGMYLEAGYKDAYNWHFTVACQSAPVPAGVSDDTAKALYAWMQSCRYLHGVITGDNLLEEGVDVEATLRRLAEVGMVERLKGPPQGGSYPYRVATPATPIVEALAVAVRRLGLAWNLEEGVVARYPWKTTRYAVDAEHNQVPMSMDDIEQLIAKYEELKARMLQLQEVDTVIVPCAAATPQPPSIARPHPGFNGWSVLQNWDAKRPFFVLEVALVAGVLQVKKGKPRVTVGSAKGEVYQEGEMRGRFVAMESVPGLPILLHTCEFLEKFCNRQDIQQVAPELIAWVQDKKLNAPQVMAILLSLQSSPVGAKLLTNVEKIVRTDIEEQREHREELRQHYLQQAALREATQREAEAPKVEVPVESEIEVKTAEAIATGEPLVVNAAEIDTGAPLPEQPPVDEPSTEEVVPEAEPTPAAV